MAHGRRSASERRLEEERKHPDELTQDERLSARARHRQPPSSSFKQAGYVTVEEIAKEMDLTRLGNVGGIGIKKARQIKAAAEHYLLEEAKKRARSSTRSRRPSAGRSVVRGPQARRRRQASP